MAKKPVRYIVQRSIHLFSDQIATLKALKKNTEVCRNEVVRVAVDDLLGQFKGNEKGLAKYVRERTNDAGHT